MPKVHKTPSSLQGRLSTQIRSQFVSPIVDPRSSGQSRPKCQWQGRQIEVGRGQRPDQPSDTRCEVNRLKKSSKNLSENLRLAKFQSQYFSLDFK
eukprot:s185_g10.t1